MKIEEQVLSVEQMKHLQDLGVDTSDASMYWVRAKRIIGKQRNNCIDRDMGKWKLSLSKSMVLPAAWARESVPTYTIGDLIEKLPKQIGWYKLSVCWKNECVEYDNWISEEVTDYIGDFNFEYRPLIESLYDCLCWVAENHKELL